MRKCMEGVFAGMGKSETGMGDSKPSVFFIYNILNFDIDGKKNAIEALASYKRNALPVLVELSTSLMNKDLRDLTFEKIKQIIS